jgi:hypothetical protein
MPAQIVSRRVEEICALLHHSTASSQVFRIYSQLLFRNFFFEQLLSSG